MSDTGTYTAPIPAQVIEHLPAILKTAELHSHAPAFDIRINPFPGDDDGQMFAIEVYANPRQFQPKDRRQNGYLEASKTTFFFNSEGGFDGEPEHTDATRYQ